MDEPELQRILGRLTRFISARERSSREVAQRLLARKICSPGQAAEVVRHLQENRLVDDSRFAANRALFRQESGYGPYRIRAELRELGISESDAEEAVRACLDSAFCDQAASLAERLLPGLMKRPDSRRVVSRRLRGRGFSERHVRLAIAALSERYPHWARRATAEDRQSRGQHGD